MRPGSLRWIPAAAIVVSLTANACVLAGSADSNTNRITVAAAADLRPAFEELGELFTEQSGTRVTFSFGSSGQLREQIRNGAPFDLFASADGAFVDDVIDAGQGRADTRADYAVGRIVLWSGDEALTPATVADLADPRYRRIVMANPAHAPYGQVAREALEAAGIYDEVESRLLYGQNISDTFRTARDGHADVGIVALSLALDDSNGDSNGDRTYELIPADLHEPLRQALVVTTEGARGDAAEAFAALVLSPQGRETLARYGFGLPDEETMP